MTGITWGAFDPIHLGHLGPLGMVEDLLPATRSRTRRKIRHLWGTTKRLY